MRGREQMASYSSCVKGLERTLSLNSANGTCINLLTGAIAAALRGETGVKDSECIEWRGDTAAMVTT